MSTESETPVKLSSSKQQFWQQHILDSSKSAMSQRRYCKTHGLPLSTFGYWKRRLRESEQNRPQFYPLTIQSNSPEKSQLEEPGLLLHVDRFRLEVVGNFSSTCLKKLIVTLEQL